MHRSKCPNCELQVIFAEMEASKRVIILDLVPEKRVVINRSGNAVIVSTYQKHECKGKK